MTTKECQREHTHIHIIKNKGLHKNHISNIDCSVKQTTGSCNFEPNCYITGPFDYQNQKKGMEMRIKYIFTLGYCNHLSFSLPKEC